MSPASVAAMHSQAMSKMQHEFVYCLVSPKSDVNLHCLQARLLPGLMHTSSRLARKPEISVYSAQHPTAEMYASSRGACTSTQISCFVLDMLSFADTAQQATWHIIIKQQDTAWQVPDRGTGRQQVPAGQQRSS